MEAMEKSGFQNFQPEIENLLMGKNLYINKIFLKFLSILYIK